MASSKRWMAACGLIVVLIGCKPDPANTIPDALATDEQRDLPLRVVVIDDEPLADVIRREWLANTQGELTVQSLRRDEFAPAVARQADVLIYPTNWLGTLAEAQTIRPLPPSARPDSIDADRDYAWEDIFPLLRRAEIRWGDTPYAVSFGSPQLLLFYRQDLFDRWGLKAPTTWREYQELQRKVAARIEHARTAGDLNDCVAAAAPLGDGWAARTLLARSAAYCRQRSQYSDIFHFLSMEPLINRPPFVRALQEMIDSNAYGSPDAFEMKPADVMQRLLDGRAVMGLTWPSATIRMTEEAVEPPSLNFAELPGSSEVFQLSASAWQTRPAEESPHVPLLGIDGRLGSMTRSARSPPAAAGFLLWITGREQGTLISSRSRHTTIFRTSQIASAAEWVNPEIRSMAGRYAEVLKQTQGRPKWLTLTRIPGHERYLDSLDEAVREAIRENQQPQRTLDGVAEEWSQITAEIGTDKQREAYHRSLGLDRL